MCDEPTGVLAGRLTSCRDRSGTPIQVMFNAVELERMSEFAQAHEKCSQGGWPVRIDTIVTPGSIGARTELVCSSCGCRTDVTDYDSW